MKRSLEKFFFLPSDQVEVKTVEITPAIAQKLLDLTDKSIQRKTNRSNLKYLVNQLELNKWKFNGDAIRQDSNGNIIDGMHRLNACLIAKKNFQTIFVKGLPPKSIHTIDQGKNRSLAEILQIKRGDTVKYATAIASVARFCNEFYQGRYGIAGKNQSGGGNTKHKALDSTDFLRWVDENPDIFSFVEENMKIRERGDKLVNAKVFCGMKWMLDQIDKDKSDRFFESLSSGLNIGKDNPIHALRLKLIRQKTSFDPSVKRLTPKQVVYCIAKTWNAYVEGKYLNRINTPPSMPKIEGLKIAA